MRVSMSALVLAVGFAGVSQAAAISWNATQDTTASAANDVVNGGAVVLAINGHNSASGDATEPADVTLDGVLFTSENTLGQVFNDPTSLGGATTGDADYDTFLNTATIVSNAHVTANGGSNTDSTYTITGLTDNVDYLIQVWYTDERTGGNPPLNTRVATYGDGEAVESTVTVNAAGANGFGQFVVGSFTADGTTQDLGVAIANAGRAHFTGVLVREVPEPGSLALLGLGGLMIARRRRA